MTVTNQLAPLLQRLHTDCAEVRGAVIATQEGLVLAATGQCDNEIAAATAAHITEVIERHLSLIQDTSCEDLFIWTKSAVWYIARVTHKCIVMATASPDCSPGMLRLVTRSIQVELSAVMSMIDSADALPVSAGD